MAADSMFKGFSRKAPEFYRDLAQNNSKEWFEEHREDFEEYIMTPAKAFVEAMGARLRELAPGLTVDPRVDRSLFRIRRDTRFSKDKRPYKTHLAIWFWEGDGPRMECSGFYFHLEPDLLRLGAGMYVFPKPQLEPYRQSVIHPKFGPALAKAVGEVEHSGRLVIGGEHYKRTPRGHDPEHRLAHLLKYKGLFAGLSLPLVEEVFSRDLVDFCFPEYREMLPLHQWLVGLTQRAR